MNANFNTNPKTPNTLKALKHLDPKLQGLQPPAANRNQQAQHCSEEYYPKTRKP